MGDEFSLDVGLALDLKNAFRRNDWSVSEIKELSMGTKLRSVREVLLGRAEIRPKKRKGSEQSFRYDKRKDGWELSENVPRSITSAADLEAVSFLKSGENSISGFDLIGRARYELGVNLGQEDAEYLLEYQAEIPEELRKYNLVFTGTIWWNPDGGLFVACLRWVGGRWLLSWGWLGHSWDSDVRLLCSRK